MVLWSVSGLEVQILYYNFIWSWFRVHSRYLLKKIDTESSWLLKLEGISCGQDVDTTNGSKGNEINLFISQEKLTLNSSYLRVAVQNVVLPHHRTFLYQSLIQDVRMWRPWDKLSPCNSAILLEMQNYQQNNSLVRAWPLLCPSYLISATKLKIVIKCAYHWSAHILPSECNLKLIFLRNEMNISLLEA